MKKTLMMLGIILFLLINGMVVSCGGSSPSNVVTSFYKAGNNGDYAKAESYLSIHTQMGMETYPFAPSSFEEQMDSATKGGNIARIEIKGGEEMGGVTIIYLTLYYKDGSEAKDVIQLKREGGKWKIFLSTLLLSAPYGYYG